MDIKELQRLNPDKKIYSIDDEAYKPYGRVLGDVCVKDLVEYIDKNIEIPASGSKYVPSVPELEAFDCVKKIEDLVYGQMEVCLLYTSFILSILSRVTRVILSFL